MTSHPVSAAKQIGLMISQQTVFLQADRVIR